MGGMLAERSKLIGFDLRLARSTARRPEIKKGEKGYHEKRRFW